MLTNNLLDPKVYQVTKVNELFPQGIIKMSMKQDEINLDRDNIDLMICDYYTSSGEANHIHVPNDNTAEIQEGIITQMIINSNGELVTSDTTNTILSRGVSSYYNVKFTTNDIITNWNVDLIDFDDLSEEEKNYYCGLIKLTTYNNSTVSVKPGKAKSLIGKRFILSAVDHSGLYHSSIELEVS